MSKCRILGLTTCCIMFHFRCHSYTHHIYMWRLWTLFISISYICLLKHPPEYQIVCSHWRSYSDTVKLNLAAILINGRPKHCLFFKLYVYITQTNLHIVSSSDCIWVHRTGPELYWSWEILVTLQFCLSHTYPHFRLLVVRDVLSNTDNVQEEYDK